MALTPADVENLIEELRKDPELRDRVRNAILAEDFLRLPATVERLADRMDQLAVRMDQLTVRVDQLTERIDRFAEATQANLIRLDATVSRLEGRVGNLDGTDFEMRYAKHVATHLTRWFTDVREVIAGNDPSLLAALNDGRLSEDDWENLGDLDVLAIGRAVADGGAETYVAIEVSRVIDVGDVERAEARAELVRRAGVPAVAAVGGRSILPAAKEVAAAKGVIALTRRTAA